MKRLLALVLLWLGDRLLPPPPARVPSLLPPLRPEVMALAVARSQRMALAHNLASLDGLLHYALTGSPMRCPDQTWLN